MRNDILLRSMIYAEGIWWYFLPRGGKKDFIKMVVRETVCLSSGDLLIHRKRSPFPAGEGFMSRPAHFVSKFLRRFFQKADGDWGGAPSVGIFFWSFSFVPSWFKRKAAKWDGRFQENEMRNEE